MLYHKLLIYDIVLGYAKVNTTFKKKGVINPVLHAWY